MNNDEKEKLIGKTIKDVKDGCEGVVLIFEDKTFQEFRNICYRDGTFERSYLTKENEITGRHQYKEK